MRPTFIALLGALVAGSAAAQGYYEAPAYGYAAPPAYAYQRPGPDAWSAAREEWHRARRAEGIARWRAENGDYEGANRAQFWADRHRDSARRAAGIARGGWKGEVGMHKAGQTACAAMTSRRLAARASTRSSAVSHPNMKRTAPPMNVSNRQPRRHSRSGLASGIWTNTELACTGSYG